MSNRVSVTFTFTHSVELDCDGLTKLELAERAHSMIASMYERVSGGAYLLLSDADVDIENIDDRIGGHNV